LKNCIVKAILKISIGLNVILTGIAVTFWMEQQRNVARYTPAPGPKAAIMPPAPTVVTQVVEESAPFRWNQLVSTNDYRIFVANLRATGCPKQTVEDIVRGDVEQVFSSMRMRQGIDGTIPGPWSGESQVKMTAYLLGQTPPEEVAEAPSPDRRKSQPRELPMETPLVLQDVDLKALGLNDDQIQMVASVRQDFLSQTGGQDQDTNNPSYRRRWRKAQQAADNMLMAQLGSQAFTKYQLMAYQLTLLNQN
jgi:hypothetical protein